jgi:RHS repeat-associated protein
VYIGLAEPLRDIETLFAGRRLDNDVNLYDYRARQYAMGLGGFASRDPMGIVGGVNLYEYVDDSPINYGDPDGLYRIWFGAGFGNTRRGVSSWEKYKPAITSALGNVASRYRKLRNEINTELNSLSPCERDILGPQVQPLLDTVAKLVSGFDSKEETYIISHGDLSHTGVWFLNHPDAHAITTSAFLIWHGQTQLNDTIEPYPWYEMTQNELEVLLFHEASHLYGTWDDDRGGQMMNAHIIERMYNGTFAGNAFWQRMKNLAKTQCDCRPSGSGL